MKKLPSDMAASPSIDCGGDMGTLQRKLRQRARDLLDPNFGDTRRFPGWTPGVSTAAYIGRYAAMNTIRKLLPLDYVHRTGCGAPYNHKEPET